LDYANEPSMKKLLTKYAEIYREREQQRELTERRRFPLEKRLKENIVGQVMKMAPPLMLEWQ
jgi:ATP-dependent Clp protease ATP-binding subunit ClpB